MRAALWVVQLQPLAKKRADFPGQDVVRITGCNGSWVLPVPSARRSLPRQLELKLFGAALALVLDAERGIAWHDDTLAQHLDGEPFVALQGVGQPAQLDDERLAPYNLLDVPPHKIFPSVEQIAQEGLARLAPELVIVVVKLHATAFGAVVDIDALPTGHHQVCVFACRPFDGLSPSDVLT